MSILADKLRAVIFSNLRADMPLPLRKASWDLFNAIDSDLDIANYTHSSDTDPFIDRFETVLGRGELEFEEKDENINEIQETPKELLLFPLPPPVRESNSFLINNLNDDELE